MALPAGLSDNLRRVLGERAGEDMVSWMENVDDRHEDAARLREAIRADFAEFRETMRADLAELRQDVRAGDATLRQEMQAGLAQLRQETQAGDLALRVEIRQAKYDLIKWSFVFWVTAVASIAALARVLR
ncbi:MAG TPA: hypothetical protein VFT29_07880 [Gemmatimonadaceae bacterium]|nr:hypothetical protein [Gemmatimonadaceae bacterium]